MGAIVVGIIVGAVSTVVGEMVVAAGSRWWSARTKRRKQARLAAAQLKAAKTAAPRPEREPWLRPRKGWLRRNR
jgi:ascorbate-specific PTS system EIIC-type component UlaA